LQENGANAQTAQKKAKQAEKGHRKTARKSPKGNNGKSAQPAQTNRAYYTRQNFSQERKPLSNPDAELHEHGTKHTHLRY